MRKTKSDFCYNCAHPIHEEAKYCSQCGQKNTDGKISLRSFLGVLFSTVFNLESKFFKTAAHLFIPGKLTIEFFKGRHKRYFHPVRLFIVAALFLIAVISLYITKSGNESTVRIEKNAIENLRRKNFLLSLDDIKNNTLKKFPANPQVANALDSLYETVAAQEKPKKDSLSMNSLILVGGVDALKINISNEDFLKLNPKELVDKYEIKGFFNRLLFQQKIKIFKDKGSFFPFLLGNSLWVFLVMMPFLALILKVFYIRHDYYYVEHLVFSFHTHVFMFFAVGILLLLVNRFDAKWLIPVIICGMLFYLFMAMRRVYQQGQFKTFIKLLAINFIYLFLFVLFMTGGVILGLALF